MPKPFDPRVPRGERCRSTKLTVEQVREIRRRRERGESMGALAREYGVFDTAIRKVVIRETWAWID